MKKILIVSLLVIISIVLIFSKENVNIDDKVYVVSHSDEIAKETAKIKENINDLENQIDGNSVTKKEITVYISGEVLNPGIVTLENDKRLYDALEKLGGATTEADLNKVNLATRLEDEQHYIIPKLGEIYENTSNTLIPTNNESHDNDKININKADIKDLDELPGVGEATANKILKYREENDRFNSVEEIKNVNGIGEKKYEEIKDLICID